jgi:hypothetical protein
MSQSQGIGVVVLIAITLVLLAGGVLVGIDMLSSEDGPDDLDGSALLRIDGQIDVHDETLTAHHQFWVTDADDKLLKELFTRANPRVLSITRSPRLHSLRVLEDATGLEALAISDTPHLDWRSCPIMPKLEDLAVGRDTPFTDDTVGVLARFPSLRFLEVFNAHEVSDDGIGQIAELQGLRDLSLYNAKAVLPGSMAKFSRSDLEVLRLGMRIGYSFDVTEWEPLGNLARLDLRRCTELDESQMEQLRRILPNTRITEPNGKE